MYPPGTWFEHIPLNLSQPWLESDSSCSIRVKKFLIACAFAQVSEMQPANAATVSDYLNPFMSAGLASRLEKRSLQQFYKRRYNQARIQPFLF